MTPSLSRKLHSFSCTGALGLATFMLVACSSNAETEGAVEADETAVLESNWDGVTKQEADAIVTLKLPQAPTGVLVNGEAAKVSVGFGQIKVLIEADDTGISCENSYIVSFSDGQKGQLLANHCHDDAVFSIEPGEMSEELVTKEDVDNPADDDATADLPEPGTSLAIGWSANGFEQIPDQYVWMGGGGDSPFLALGVPETDDGIWSSYCDSGVIVSDVYLIDDKLAAGARSTLKVETDAGPTQTYAVSARENGLGLGYQLRSEPGTGPVQQMTKGDWLYLQMGEGDGAGKIRVSLAGVSDKATAMLDACKG